MAFPVEYPRRLEDWWIQLALRQLSCNSLDEREAQIERSIQYLSDRFTTQRSNNLADENYFSNPELLCAYGLFFFPQNYVRTAMVLQEILSRGWEQPEKLSILDLGSGTGAASFSAASLFRQTPITLTAVDRSREALNNMRALASDCSELWPLLQSTFHSEDIWSWCKRRQGQQWDLILASFALNESSFSTSVTTEVLTNLLSERGILILVEPALKTTSEKLESWRDEIALRSDLHIWGPCLHQSVCPLLQEGKYWCHEVRSWHPPASLSFLNRHLYRQVHVLKFSFLAVGKQPPQTPGSSAFRLISPVSKRKKALLFSGCTAQGKKKDFQISDTLIGHERNEVKKWERGDIVTSFDLKQEKFS